MQMLIMPVSPNAVIFRRVTMPPDEYQQATLQECMQ